MRLVLVPGILIALAVLAAARAEVPGDVTLEPVAGVSGLTGPLGLEHAGDGSGRLFIVEQGGTVRVVDAGGALLAEPFLELGDRVAAGGERGLLDIAFHPEFAVNGRFFAHYSAGATRPPGTDTGDTVVAEFGLGADPNVADPEPVGIVLTVSQDFSNHNGGQMEFGPDGYLYLALGDGGSSRDPCNRAQTLRPDSLVTPSDCGSSAPLNDSLALLGKILRIDVDQPTAAGDNDNLCAAGDGNPAAYSVPAENPFADDPAGCGEILLYGLRNPWRLSFDRATGDLWIGDVGQNQWEEIDLLGWPVTGGENLGWDCYEASSAFEAGSDPACPDPSEMLFPVIEYDHASTGGCSVTGGYRYRGPVESLRGFYIFGDFCSGEIWLADNGAGVWERKSFATGFGNLKSFGEDQIGNVYAIAGNELFRFAGELTDTIFADGFEDPH